MLKNAIFEWSACGLFPCSASSRETGSGETKTKGFDLAKTLLVMKLTILFLTVGFLNVSAKGLSQNVSFSGKEVALESVFSSVEKQTGFLFFYDKFVLESSRPFSISVKDISLVNFLEKIFTLQPSLQYKIEGRSVFVSLRESFSSNPQPSTRTFDVLKDTLIDVNGRCLNENGDPIIASIIVKGTTKGVTTNQNGKFTLTDIEDDAVLLITGVGIETAEIKIKGKSQLNITVKISVKPLDETVIIAYGSTSKRFNTGNVSTVKATTIEKQPVNNPLQAMQGRMPGVFITQTTGMPSGSFTIQIRGRNSIAYGTDPLYVIDGVPYVSSFGNTNISSPRNINPTGGNPLNFINPSDIESINVLKDADATAIYGSRGANGVVLITTKKGKEGKLKLNVNVYSGLAKAPLRVDWLNTPQYLAMRREAFANDNVIPMAFNAPDLFDWDTTRYTDWQKTLIGGTAHYYDAQVSISGGSTNLQYVFGGGYHRESTVFPTNEADKKASVHFNVTNTSLNQRAKFIMTANYVQNNSNLPKVDYTNYIATAPNAPSIYNADGSLNWANSTWDNPFAYKKQKYASRNHNLIGNAIASYKIIDGLEVKSSFGYSLLQMSDNYRIPISSVDPGFSPTGEFVFSKSNVQSWIIEPQASYQRSIGKGSLDALIGTTFQQNTSEGELISSFGYTSDALLGNLLTAPNIQILSIVDATYKYNAFWGRLNYKYDDKYLVNVTARRDGSSRFGAKNRFQNFGAIAIAWIFSKERIIQEKLSFLSFGKLRFSYGTTGNDQIGDYKFYDLYRSSSYQYQSIVGLNPSGIFNPYLAWEETKKLEAGLETGFVQDRIIFSASYFRNRSGNQLVDFSLPSTTGFSTITSNLSALIQNSGWEFLLNTINIRNRNFTWETSINLTVHRNKLMSYPELSTSVYANSYIIGRSLSIFKLYDCVGVDPQTGRYQFMDKDRHLTLSPAFFADRTAVVDRAPKYYGGFQNSFSYKGFDLEIFFQFVKQIGSDPLFQFGRPAGFGLGGLGNRPIEILSRWQKPGDIAKYQKASQSFASPAFGSFNNAISSNYGYSAASYIRLKNLSLTYNLPVSWIRSLRLQAFQVYIHGQNLFTITKYKGLDPETQSMTKLPPLKVLTFGAKLSL